jgi:hypothetical protein
MSPDVGSRSLEHALAYGNADVATAHHNDIAVLCPITCRNTSSIHHHTTSPHPIGKPTGPWRPRTLGSLKTHLIIHIATSSLPPSIHPQITPVYPPAMPTADICCLHPPHRSLSPVEPARPSHTPLLSLDGIFAVAALPNDHPHSMKISVQDRRPPKNLIRSPSLVGKLRGQLRRRATVRSLRAEIVGDCEGDGNARVLA